MTWLNIPDDISPFVGFVYSITEKSTGKIYFGIKRFFRVIKRKPLKGKKRKRLETVETDWKDYNTSNAYLQERLSFDPFGYGYEKKILRCCTSLTELKAWEAWYQLDYYVNDKWHLLFNECVNLRLRIRK